MVASAGVDANLDKSVVQHIYSAFTAIIEKIIAQQEAIIGPLAVEQAQSIQGLQVDWSKRQVDFSGDPKKIVDQLVDEYKNLFGQIAVQTCKDAASRDVVSLPKDLIPNSLK